MAEQRYNQVIDQTGGILMSEYPSVCGLCKFAKKTKDKRSFVCPYHVLVDYDATCENFAIDYLKIEPKRRAKRKLQQFSPDDFSIED